MSPTLGGGRCRTFVNPESANDDYSRSAI